ncbi:MAG TPA: tyrosine-type recombinase/integrase [Candidatus Dormibacteraeota bacterium]|nr:tyrosine-type recombinase/integrase [Candidatus Dormibacteraeota bacterium]
MTRNQTSLDEIFETQIRTLALTLRPKTVGHYRTTVRQFLAYLHAAFPKLRRLSQLRRDPHLLGWFRSLCEQQPPWSNTTRIGHLIFLRRLLEDLAANGHSLPPDLIRREDFPPKPHYLPRSLPPEQDQLLQQELRRSDDLAAHALLLTRASGIRIGECLDLPLDSLRQLGDDQWALHVPLGKLHNERLVPADPELRRIVERILALRALAPPSHLANSPGLLLARPGCRDCFYRELCSRLAQAAKRVGCSRRVTPHVLRHDFATEMLRLGVSLPALMQLLGHRDIRMTLRYLQITQQDLQREFRQARQNAVHPHRLPTLSLPNDVESADLPGIRQALAATRHLLEMYRRQRSDEKTKRKLERLDRRLRAVASQLERINQDENEERLVG